MRLERRIAAAFRMSDEAWERHANPWSVWTRFAGFPALVAAVWSRAWLGRWAIVPIAAGLLWIWVNPRVFGRPTSTNTWASKAVLGERVWMDRDRVHIPPRYQVAPGVLNVLSALALLPVAWGLARRDIRPTALGTVLTILLKACSLECMVRLYDDMKDATPEYRSWLY